MTNAIESVNRSLRKISKNRGVLPTKKRCSNCITGFGTNDEKVDDADP